MSPDFLLADDDLIATELSDAAADGARIGDRRAAGRLRPKPFEARGAVTANRRTYRCAPRASITSGSTGRRTGASGYSMDELADLFVADVVEGIDERDYSGPVIRRTEVRAGIVKVGRQRGGGPSRSRSADLRGRRRDPPPNWRPGSHPLRGGHRRTRADPASRRRRRAGRPTSRSATSTRSSIAGITASSSRPERSPSTTRPSAGDTAANGTLRLLEWAVEDGHAGQIMLGMDAARQGYSGHIGGSPGLRVPAARVQLPRWRRAASTPRSDARSSSTIRPGRSRLQRSIG